MLNLSNPTDGNMMQVHYGLDAFKKLDKAIVTSGTFDGVHIGHQKILQRLKEVAKATGGETVVLTFWPHPRFVLFPNEQDLKLLTSLDEKIYLLNKYGISHLVVLPFNKELSQTSSADFIREILIEKIGTHKLVIGYDHRFGRNREGSFEYLMEHASELGFGVEEIPRQDIDDVAVSSTKIRKALLQGDINIANAYLGSEYMLTGTVARGQQIGRRIGYPTANIVTEEPHKLIPDDGIYAVYAETQGLRFKGMLYIGPRPTIGTALQRTIEVNLFDFGADIYDAHIRLYLVAKLRGDQKFPDLDALKSQLAQDRQDALRVL